MISKKFDCNKTELFDIVLLERNVMFSSFPGKQNIDDQVLLKRLMALLRLGNANLY